MCVQTATAITTASVTVLVAIITWRQWVTNRARLQHELFDRRYATYSRIAAFLADILVTGKVPVQGDVQFLRETKEATFVFGCDPSVKKFLQNIHNDVLLLQTLDFDLERLVGEKRSANLDKGRIIKSRLQVALNSMESRFEKYLRLRH